MNNPLIYSDPRGMSWFSDIWDGFWSLINGDYNSQTGQYEGGVAQIFRNMNVPDFEVGYNSGMGSFYRLGNNDKVYPSYNSAVNKGLKQTNKNIELAVNYNSPMNGTLNDKFNKYFSDYIYRNSVRLVYDPTFVKAKKPGAAAFTMPEKNADGQYEVIFSDITDEFQIYVQTGHELIHVANRMENNFLHITEPAAFHWMDIVSQSGNKCYEIMLHDPLYKKYRFKSSVNTYILSNPDYFDYKRFGMPTSKNHFYIKRQKK